MLTGELRSKIDSIWNDFWSGGLANPLQVIEQITFLIFIKRLDEMQEVDERKATMLNRPLERRIFPAGVDEKGEPWENLRWSRFKNFAGPEMFRTVDERVFPFLRGLNGNGGEYAKHMRDARFQIPSPQLLTKVVEKLDKIDMGDRDTKGDVYEYMLAKIASAGQNGQLRTPRHIIALMVELMQPKPEDVICDPAAGTCGFLVQAGEYSRHMREVKRLSFWCPPIDLQRAFAARVAEIDDIKDSHRAHLEKLDALFAALQHRAFRGDLTENVQPAHALA